MTKSTSNKEKTPNSAKLGASSFGSASKVKKSGGGTGSGAKTTKGDGSKSTSKKGA
jgi:hypothetical protein